MISQLKEIKFLYWVLTLLIGALISAGGLLYAQTQKKIEKKIDSKTIMNIMQQNKEQRKEDLEELKDQRREQQTVNKQLYEAIQQLLIENAKKGGN